MKVLLLIASLIACSQAYSFKIAADVKHPGVCIFNGKTLQIGENRVSNKCQIIHCYEDGSIYVEGCGYSDKTESRIIDQLNTDKVYPECCKEVSLEKGQVQGIKSSKDAQIYSGKDYLLENESQGKLEKNLYSQKYYPQGEYSQRYPMGYQQGEYSQRYPMGHQEGEYSQRYYPKDYQKREYSQLNYPLGYQQGEYSQRYYPQEYYNQEQYQNYETKNKDYMSEYRRGYPLSYLNRRPSLLDSMYGRRVNV